MQRQQLRRWLVAMARSGEGRASRVPKDIWREMMEFVPKPSILFVAQAVRPIVFFIEYKNGASVEVEASEGGRVEVWAEIRYFGVRFKHNQLWILHKKLHPPNEDVLSANPVLRVDNYRLFMYTSSGSGWYEEGRFIYRLVDQTTRWIISEFADDRYPGLL